MKNNPIDVKNANLKMVPYWVIKKPSDPSLITSAISCIFLGPQSFLRISHSMYIAMIMKTIEIIQAEKETTLDVDYDTNM